MHPNGSWHCIAALVCTFTLSGSNTAEARSTPAPCSLLSPAQVSAAVGANVGAGQPIAAGCTWTAPHIIATLTLRDASGWENMKTAPGMTITPVTGLGEDAYFAMSAGAKPFAALSVKKGSTAVVFHIYGVAGAADQMSMEKALAVEVLGKL